jgi:hypothetical protein
VKYNNKYAHLFENNEWKSTKIKDFKNDEIKFSLPTTNTMSTSATTKEYLNEFELKKRSTESEI